MNSAKFNVGDCVKFERHGDMFYGIVYAIDYDRPDDLIYVVECDDGDGHAHHHVFESQLYVNSVANIKGGFDMSNVSVNHPKSFSDAIKEYQELKDGRNSLLEIILEITGRSRYDDMTLDAYIEDCKDMGQPETRLGLKLIFDMIRDIDKKIENYNGMQVVNND